MQTPALRHLILIGMLAAAASLAACNGDDSQPVAQPATPPKAACGNVAAATVTLHCPPGFTAPKS
ncbi:hypothetical protein [Burkholderia glumae]|uniref:Lipoprotein n=1 Tax=Burkholderia glumae TaxID=337 RepID=A0AAQ0BVG9_BURGL|nr:hypothetical protein [Burkholderia glumae]ACR28955.1 Hypothetical protein bglu_1g18310 [Burkholderia glumae BGR1]AJY66987.1 hypothetical protein KS03_2684 [Burkholderia glumae LMG 2196 = ATCC 33617]KHJ62535.1 hypothetical protein NCPPB3923_12965 [Burkholderia glumae]MCM2483204.1 hypothetical protein [Burkholderia glumae]MCM2493341.1 hypothetical protein [Burkholderia glumae]